VLATSLGAQAPQQPVLDRLTSMPGYAQFAKMQESLRSGGPAFTTGALSVTWVDQGKAFTYNLAGKAYRFDMATRQATVTGDAPPGPAGGGRGGPGRGGGGAGGRGGAPGAGGCPPENVDRGRQRSCEGSPDGKQRAFYRNRNLWIANADGSNERQITTDGIESKRTKSGSGSWVYGEELNRRIPPRWPSTTSTKAP
jgi:hypothetical protein